MQIDKLPKLADLHHDPEVAKKADEFKSVLNQPPPPDMLKKNAMAGNALYIPIDKVEFMMDRIFQNWRVEVLTVGVMFQSIYVTIRLHYQMPTTGEWTFHDGVGAKSVQTDKGESAANLSSIKDAAIMMALPTAKSLAIKDAAGHIGKLFGRDLARKDTIAFYGTYGNVPANDNGHYML